MSDSTFFSPATLASQSYEQTQLSFLKDAFLLFLSKFQTYLNQSNQQLENAQLLLLKQKLIEEKDCWKFYQFVQQLQLKKQPSELKNIHSHARSFSLKLPFQKLAKSKQNTVEDQSTLQMSSSSRKTPTSIKTVQIDMFKQNNYDKLLQSSNKDSPVKLNLHHHHQSQLPSKFERSNSFTEKNIFQVASARSIPDSPQIQTPGILPVQTVLSRGNSVAVNLNVVHNVPSIPSKWLNESKSTFNAKIDVDNSISSQQQISPPKSNKTYFGDILTAPSDSSKENKIGNLLNINSSNSNSSNSVQRKNQNPLNQHIVKRISPQQFLKMKSITDDDDYEGILGNVDNSGQKQGFSSSSLQYLLELVKIQQNNFKKDQESMTLIHGKSSLASAENCRGSTCIESYKMKTMPSEQPKFQKHVMYDNFSPI